MEIAIIGDVHGNGDWLIRHVLPEFADRGIKTLIQLGDFGLYPMDRGFQKMTNWALEKFGQTIYVAPGNHENYDYISEIPVSSDGWQHARSNILLAPRGHRAEFGGRSFVFLGGAPSVDRWYRTVVLDRGGPYWWADEAITQEDVDKTVAGGHADVMVAHDAPLNVPGIEAGIAGNPFGFKESDLKYADEGRVMMEQAFQGVSPDLFLNGHYHFFNEDTVPTRLGTCQVVTLSCDEREQSFGILDTKDLSISVL